MVETSLLLFNLALEDGWGMKKKRGPVSFSFCDRRIEYEAF